MEKRYQVFVSSTYVDLKEERTHVIQALMEMDCIPAGMELFPALDEEQWEFIKKVIDDCDYYLLIIGGRYGSVTAEGISYTEKEYDYAIEKGIKVVALVHGNPNELPVSKSELKPELRDKLENFKGKVKTNRLVKFWNTANELPGLVALSLSKTIKTYPAVGWIRANQGSSTELLTEINELRKKNDELENQLSKTGEITKIEIPNLATFNDKFTIVGKYKQRITSNYIIGNSWNITTNWGHLFYAISPYIVKSTYESEVKTMIAEYFFPKSGSKGTAPTINDQKFQTIKIQLMAMKLIDINYDENDDSLISLTEFGYSQMINIRTQKTEKIEDL